MQETAGNHDAWTPAAPLEAFRQRTDLLYLDGDVRTVDGLRLPGLSGIIGNSHKPFRRSPADYTSQLRRLTEQQPDLLILHESPEVRNHHERGSALVGAVLETQPVPLTVCGHVHWRVPVAELPGGAQILNVDGRVMILLRSHATRGGGDAGRVT